MPSLRRSPGKWLLLAPLLLAMLFLAGEDSRGQGPGGGRRGMDPDAVWLKMTGGQDVDKINLNENAPLKGMMTKMGSPIPADGILTKEQFKAGFQQRMQAGKFGPGTATAPGVGTAPPGGDPAPTVIPAGPGGPGNTDWMDGRFRQMDANGDGRLTPDEVSERMKPDFAKYDANGDGAIALDEYKAYAAQRMAGGGRGGPNNGPDNGNGGPGQQFNPQDQGNYPQQDNSPRRPREPQQEEETTRPDVYRFGKLPKGIPDWFEKLDTDQDGMVGLYEWRRAGKSISEFVKMDLNADGYLTADEWLRSEKRKLDPKGDDKPTTSVRVERPADAGNSGGSGGRGPGGRGPGGNRGGDASANKGGDKGSDAAKGSDNGGQKGGKGKGKGKGGEKPNPFTDGK